MQMDITKLSPPKRVEAATNGLLFQAPFFGGLIMQLRMFLSEEIDTACTDGTNLIYSPTFIEKITHKQLKTVGAHEVMHCALRHPWRIGTREIELANYAADVEVNNLLMDFNKTLKDADKFELPDGCVMRPEFRGKVFEVIYNELLKNRPTPLQLKVNFAGSGLFTPGNMDIKDMCDKSGKEKEEEGDGDNAPGKGKGKKFVIPIGGGNGDESEGDGEGQEEGQGSGNGEQEGEGQPSKSADKGKRLSQYDWELAVESAVQIFAKKAGTIPGGWEFMFDKVGEPKIDWRAYLAQFVEHIIQGNYSYSRLNKNALANGFIVPGFAKENCPKIAFMIDVSGSVSDQALAAVSPEATEILLNVRPSSITVVYCDTVVKRVDVFEPDEHDQVIMKAHGRGGTELRPGLDKIRELEEESGEPFSCIIMMTDLFIDERDFDGYEPTCPVLIMCPEHQTNMELFDRIDFAETILWSVE